MAAATMGAQMVRTYRPERAVCERVDGLAEVTLNAHARWWAAENLCWHAILCLAGVIWITQDSDLQDHLLKPGEMFLVSRRGKVIVSALANARFKVTPSLVAPPFFGSFEDALPK